MRSLESGTRYTFRLLDGHPLQCKDHVSERGTFRNVPSLVGNDVITWSTGSIVSASS